MKQSFNLLRKYLYQLPVTPFLWSTILGFTVYLVAQYGFASRMWTCIALVWLLMILGLSKTSQHGYPRFLSRVLTSNFASIRLASGRWGIYQRRIKHHGPLDCTMLVRELVNDQVNLPAALTPGKYRAITHDTILRRLKRMKNARSIVAKPVYLSNMKSIYAAMTGKRCKKCKEPCPFLAQREQSRQFYDVKFEITNGLLK